MNLREMILEVRSGLDEPTEDFWTDAEIIRWLNQAVGIMCSTCQPLQAIWEKTVTASSQEYVLPEDVVRVFSVGYLLDARYYQLRPCDFMGVQDGVLVTGTPTHFYLRNRSLQTGSQTSTGVTVTAAYPNQEQRAAMILGLVPVPANSTDKLLVYYFSRAYRLINDGDSPPIPEEFHDGICAYAVAKGKEKDSAFMEASEIYWPKYRAHLEELKNYYLMDGQDMRFPHVQVPEESEFYADGRLMDARFIIPS